MNLAWMQNGVIASDDGKNITYHPRCPYCGYVSNTVTAGYSVSKGNLISLGYYHCLKCQKSFEIKTGRG